MNLAMGFSVVDILEGKVTGITGFGVFVDLGEGKSGMVHISEVAQTYVNDINEHVKVGDVKKVKVMTISEEGKIALSIKRAEEPKPIAPRQPKIAPKPDNSVVWAPKSQEGATFEDMMAKFKQTSEEKMSDLKRKNNDSRRPKRGAK